ncbi:13730_t:CDS:2, partial [Racocetra fulgida]
LVIRVLEMLTYYVLKAMKLIKNTKIQTARGPNVSIVMETAEAKIMLHHSMMYDKPNEVTVPSEIKQTIKENLEMSPVYLQIYLRK